MAAFHNSVETICEKDCGEGIPVAYIRTCEKKILLKGCLVTINLTQNDPLTLAHIFFRHVTVPVGIEPTTLWLTATRSNRLNYRTFYTKKVFLYILLFLWVKLFYFYIAVMRMDVGNVNIAVFQISKK